VQLSPKMAVLLLVAAGITAPRPARAAELAGAEVLLEVLEPPRPGFVPEAAPVRFALFPDGRVFVGGTDALMAGRLEGRAAKEVQKRCEQLRKLKGLSREVRFGDAGSPHQSRWRLRYRKRGMDVEAVGDPAQAPSGLEPLARLFEWLSSFDDPGLRPYQPESYLLRAREGRLPGGCRTWPLRESLDALTRAPLVVPASAAGGWPSGAWPASVCSGERRFVVTFRPLVPGEIP